MVALAENYSALIFAPPKDKPFSDELLGFFEAEEDPKSLYGLLLNTVPFAIMNIFAMLLIVIFL